jgi:hypothetical protein
MHKIIYQTKRLQRHDEAVHFGIRHRCPNCKQHVLVEKQLVAHLRRVCARKPFQCDRCRKRFPERDWLAEHKVWHIEVDLDRYFKWFDLYAYPCFYCCNYFASAADVRTHILADHINNQPFKITIKKEATFDCLTSSVCSFEFLAFHREIKERKLVVGGSCLVHILVFCM